MESQQNDENQRTTEYIYWKQPICSESHWESKASYRKSMNTNILLKEHNDIKGNFEILFLHRNMMATYLFIFSESW